MLFFKSIVYLSISSSRIPVNREDYGPNIMKIKYLLVKLILSFPSRFILKYEWWQHKPLENHWNSLKYIFFNLKTYFSANGISIVILRKYYFHNDKIISISLFQTSFKISHRYSWFKFKSLINLIPLYLYSLTIKLTPYSDKMQQIY